MDQLNSITTLSEHQRGKHLSFEDRVILQTLLRQGYSIRAIARKLNCSPSTVSNEIKRGTPLKKCRRGRKPVYTAQRGQAAYDQKRKNCGPSRIRLKDNPFILWMVQKVKKDKWSLDSCCGYAREHNLFMDELIPCTRTLYNALHRGDLSLTLFDVPEVLSRRPKGKGHKRNRKILGTSIDERPEIISERKEIGHWEIDTVVGKRSGKEPVILTLNEKVTGYYLTRKIRSKDSSAVNEAMKELMEEFGSGFSKVFKSITSDNGSEFAELTNIEGTGSRVYFAHPYSSWERGQNENLNRQLRRFIRKGKSIQSYSEDQVLDLCDVINEVPRKALNYRTPEELFEAFLDEVYSTSNTAA